MNPLMSPKFPRQLKLQFPDERPQENTEEAGIPVTKIVDGGLTVVKNSDSDDNRPISFCVKRRSGGAICINPKVKTSQDSKGSNNWDLSKNGIWQKKMIQPMLYQLMKLFPQLNQQSKIKKTIWLSLKRGEKLKKTCLQSKSIRSKRAEGIFL